MLSFNNNNNNKKVTFLKLLGERVFWLFLGLDWRFCLGLTEDHSNDNTIWPLLSVFLARRDG